ncbi:SIS domain-containing protein [Acephala macrosclerotiorum]|nr:SIS domain-containing protein [Acephala macrosclerotiorum]
MAAIDLSSLQTEGRNPRTTHIDTMSTLEMWGRLIYVGAGTSGRLGILDASEIPPTFSAPSTQFVGIIAGGDAAIRTAQEGAEDSHSLAFSDLESLSVDPELDNILGIAASGRTPYVLACLKFTKEKGCLTVGVACVSESQIKTEGNADHVIEVITGPEVVTGSTRLKAGTRTKMVLNMLSTGIVVKIGKTFGNMMVDLKATNIKLKQRSRNIVRSLELTASELSDEELDARIAECGGSVKFALMTLMTGCERQHCEEILEQAGGVLSTALQTINATASNTISNGKIKSRNSASEGKLAVCIDGGGSKRAVALSDEAGNIGRGEAGPCNVVNFIKVRAGIVGFDRPEMPKVVEEALSNLFNIPVSPNLRVTNDVDFASAIEKHPGVKTGIVLVAGTGSVAMSYRIKSGITIRTGRAGGHGSVLGDGGSGFDIGKIAIQHTLSEPESAMIGTENQKGVLKDALRPLSIQIMGKLQVPEGSDVSFDVLSHVLTAESPERSNLKLRMASLAPTIVDASSYDMDACGIVHRAVHSLVSMMLRLVRPESVVPSESVLVLAGGLMKNAVYRRFLSEILGELNVVFRLIDVIEDGALAGLLSLS